MALQIKSTGLATSRKHIGIFVAILAFLIQPLVTLNIPSVFAATANVAQLEFTTAAQTIAQNASSSMLTVQTQNASGSSEKLDTSGTKLKLATSSATGEFSENGSSGWTHAPTFTMASNSSNKNFYYRDSTAGTPTLTATASDVSDAPYAWSAATQTIMIVAAPALEPHTVCASGCEYTTIAAAVAGESDGDTITVKPGSYAVTSTIVINKLLTIKGESGAAITTSGGQSVFLVTAPNVSVKGLAITKTDTATQTIFGVQAGNFTASGNTITGQYNLGGGDIERAFEVSGGLTGLALTGNTISHLRQAAYINNGVSGTITGNELNNSRGWVVVSDTDLIFDGNTWANNATDIAIISQDNSANNYPCSKITTIRQDNNNASVDNQVLLRHCVTLPAQTTTIVRPSSLNGWSGMDDNGNGGSLTFVSGPSTAPLGDGSAQLGVVSANQGYILAKSSYGGLKLADIAILDYSTYSQTGNNLLAPTLQLNVTPDVGGAAGWYGRLVYEPYMNGTVSDNTWQTWHAADGKWWLTKPASFGGHCAQNHPCTFDQLISHYPNIGVNASDPLVGFKAGSAWTNYTGNIDGFHIAAAGVNDLYNFEPSIQLAAPTNLTPADGSYTKDPAFSMGWSAVENAAGYQYRTSNSINGNQLGPIIYCDGSVTVGDGCNGASYHLVPSNFTVSQGAVSRGNSGTPAGDYYWQVRAIDSDGVAGPWSAIAKVTTDYTKPNAVLVSPVDGAYNPTGHSVTANDNASLSVVAAHLYDSSNMTLLKSCSKSSLDGQTSYTLDCAIPTNLADGSYVIRYNAKDSAGNLSATKTSTIVVDHAKPVVKVNLNRSSYISSSASTNSASNPELEATDPNLDRVELWKGTTKISTWTATSNSRRANIAWLGEGTYVIRAYDKAGNGSDDFVVTIDNTKPIINSVTYSNNGSLTNQNVVVTITTTESVIAPTGWTPSDSSGQKFIRAYTSNTTDSVNVRDGAGNTSDPKTITVTGIDKAAPSVTVSGSNSGGVYTSDVLYTVSDNVGISSLIVDGASAPSSGTITGDGIHKIVATDTAGNSTTREFTIDTTAPELTVNQPLLNNDGTYTISGTADSSTQQVSISVDSGIPVVVQVINGLWSYTTGYMGAGTTHIVDVKTSDAYGNTASQSRSFTVPSVGGSTVNTINVLSRIAPIGATGPVVPVGATGPTNAASPSANASNEADDNGEVLGTKDGTPLKNTAALTPSDQGWKLFGTAWYWWLLGLAVIVGLWWLLVARRRRAEKELF